ncbi:MAG: DegT/DnrJ/EryC1/StrS family aminotransferase [Thermoleophilaceae bacterium]
MAERFERGRGRLGVWAPLPPTVWLRPPLRQRAFPLGEPGHRLLAFARQGLWLGVRTLGLGPGDEVLVPAYHHGSEVEALRRAGLRCRFYESDALLEPLEESLEQLLGPHTRALHLIHFFGFPQDGARWRRFCDNRGLLLIEDAAQAWLSTRDDRPVGSLGDLAIFCMYKMVGLPDEGSAMLLPEPATRAALDRRPGAPLLARKHAQWLASRLPPAGRMLEPRRQRRPYDAEGDCDLGDPEAMPWSTTRFLLDRLGEESVAARRRRNYRVLLEALGDRVASGFRSVPAGASPFLLPVETDDKHALIERLDRLGIEAWDVWSTPHSSLPRGEFPDAEARRARTVGLPVHQELRLRDLERIAAAVP